MKGKRFIACLCALALTFCGWVNTANAGELKLPTSGTEIGEEAFYGNKAITSVTLPRGIKRLARGLSWEPD